MEKASDNHIDKIDMGDPIIKQELEGKSKLLANHLLDPQPIQVQNNYLPVENVGAKIEEGKNYNTFGGAPYPMKVDKYVYGQVEADSKERKSKWNFLNCFKKLQGEDERQNFLIKVLGILTFQVFLTVFFISIVWMNEGVKTYLKEHIWVYFTALVLSIITLCIIVCFRSVGRKTPYNYIALIAFTLFESTMLATITTFYDTKSVLICAVLSLVMFTTLVLIAL